METTGQAMDGPIVATPPWSALRRQVLIICSAIAGVVVGLAVLTALAHPAGASAVPTDTAPPAPAVPVVAVAPVVAAIPVHPAVSAVSTDAPVAAPVAHSVIQVVASTVAPVSGAVASATAAVPVALATIDAADAAVDPAVSALAATPLRALATPAGVLPTLDPVPGATGPRAPGTTPAPGPSSLATDGGPRGSRAASLRPVAAATRLAGPVPARPWPTRAPPAPAPVPSPVALPPTAGDAGGAPAPGQGSGLSGSLPPSARLRPAVESGTVDLAPHGASRLLLDARSSPPG